MIPKVFKIIAGLVEMKNQKNKNFVWIVGKNTYLTMKSQNGMKTNFHINEIKYVNRNMIKKWALLQIT